MSFATMSQEEADDLLKITADSLAKRAGVDASGPLTDDGLTDEQRVTRLKMQLGYGQRWPRPRQTQLLGETAAKYLPALMTAYMSASGATNAPMLLINFITASPYFVRFSKTSAASSLTATQAHRVAETDKDALDHDTAAEACQFLATLIMLQGVGQIPAEDVPALKSLMTAWGRRFRGRFAEETAERIQMILVGGRDAQEGYALVREKIWEPLTTCNAPGCSRKQMSTGGNLMQCARCKTAVYCCAEHQKVDWRSHKGTCFAPAF